MDFRFPRQYENFNLPTEGHLAPKRRKLPTKSEFISALNDASGSGEFEGHEIKILNVSPIDLTIIDRDKGRDQDMKAWDVTYSFDGKLVRWQLGSNQSIREVFATELKHNLPNDTPAPTKEAASASKELFDETLAEGYKKQIVADRGRKIAQYLQLSYEKGDKESRDKAVSSVIITTIERDDDGVYLKMVLNGQTLERAGIPASPANIRDGLVRVYQLLDAELDRIGKPASEPVAPPTRQEKMTAKKQERLEEKREKSVIELRYERDSDKKQKIQDKIDEIDRKLNS